MSPLVAAAAFAVFAVAAAFCRAAPAAPEVATVAAATQALVGELPTGGPRSLAVGAGVFNDDVIRSAEVGAGNFIFVDGSSLLIWPNSEIVIDRYVFDAGRDEGVFNARMARGVLRFIGGRLSKNAEARIDTPHGVVSIRGGIAQIEVTGAGTRVIHLAGEYARLGEVTLSRPHAVAESAAGDGGALRTQFAGLLDGAALAAVMSAPVFRDGGSPDPAIAIARLPRTPGSPSDRQVSTLGGGRCALDAQSDAQSQLDRCDLGDPDEQTDLASRLGRLQQESEAELEAVDPPEEPEPEIVPNLQDLISDPRLSPLFGGFLDATITPIESLTQIGAAARFEGFAAAVEPGAGPMGGVATGVASLTYDFSAGAGDLRMDGFLDQRFAGAVLPRAASQTFPLGAELVGDRGGSGSARILFVRQPDSAAPAAFGSFMLQAAGGEALGGNFVAPRRD